MLNEFCERSTANRFPRRVLLPLLVALGATACAAEVGPMAPFTKDDTMAPATNGMDMEMDMADAGAFSDPEHAEMTPDEVALLPVCLDDPTEVAIIGDSYISWPTHTFVADLSAESGQAWPSYALGGTSMATGGLFGFIPPQFDAAIAAHPTIKTVIMDGGGNDIILPDTAMFPEGTECTKTTDAPNIEDCQKIVDAAVEAASELLQRMADAGVEQVVYLFYPHIPGGGLISGPNPNAILDYALPIIREVCESAVDLTLGKLTCHFADMVPPFEGRPELFSDAFSPTGDGVHPNSEGSKVMAGVVWEIMQDNCIAQPTGNDCCAPAP